MQFREINNSILIVAVHQSENKEDFLQGDGIGKLDELLLQMAEHDAMVDIPNVTNQGLQNHRKRHFGLLLEFVDDDSGAYFQLLFLVRRLTYEPALIHQSHCISRIQLHLVWR